MKSADRSALLAFVLAQLRWRDEHRLCNDHYHSKAQEERRERDYARDLKLANSSLDVELGKVDEVARRLEGEAGAEERLEGLALAVERVDGRAAGLGERGLCGQLRQYRCAG